MIILSRKVIEGLWCQNEVAGIHCMTFLCRYYQMKMKYTEDEMVGWYHRLNGHESEQVLGVGEGQGSLVCCSPWGCKESDTTEQLS